MCLLRLSKLSTAQHFIWANFDHCFDFHATWRQSLGFLTRPKVERKFLFILANHKNGDGHGSQPKTKKNSKKPRQKSQKIQRTVADKPKSVRYSVGFLVCQSVGLSVFQSVIQPVSHLVSRSAKRLRVQVVLSVAAQIPPARFFFRVCAVFEFRFLDECL